LQVFLYARSAKCHRDGDSAKRRTGGTKRGALQGGRFLIVAGHDAQDARVVEDHDGYSIIEKSGVAGRIAEEENPRR